MRAPRRTALRLVLAAQLGLLLAPRAAWADQVTFVITRLPEKTPPNQTFTLGANLGSWNPATPGFAFAPDAQGRPSLTLELRAGTNVEYKVTRGGWGTVEKNADGSEMKNRVLEVNGTATVELRVERWVDSPGAVAPPRSTVSGHVEVLQAVKSPELSNSRDVRVYLPPSYARGTQRYPVLYLHDGQNVFDEATAFVKQEWHADEAAEALAKTGRELIIVAVDNTGDRRSEYAPFRAPMNDYQARGDRYLAFLTTTLKPMIDAKYRTRPDPAHTGLAGSSLGGLITLYGVLANPGVFGFGAAFSPSLSSADFNLQRWAKGKPATKPVRLYLDMGDKEGDSSAWNQVLVESTEDLARQLSAQGYETRVQIAKGGHHNEDAWAPRLPPVLEWFLTERAPDAGQR